MSAISTHPELNRLSLKHGIDAAYLIWCVLRAEISDKKLSGHFTKNQVKNLCREIGLNYTSRHFKRILKSGDGILWGLGYGSLHIRSFKRVYSRLADTTATNQSSVNFVKIEIYKSSQTRRAELYWSWFRSREEITISRETITEIFNLSPAQQRAYEKLLGDTLLVRTNYAHIGLKEWQNKPCKLPSYYYTYEREIFENDTVSTVTEIVYQLPNTFIARNKPNGCNPVVCSTRRALNATRTQYRTTEHLYNQKRYYRHIDQWQPENGLDCFVRTYYNGKKRIYRIGHYIKSLISV